METLNLYQVSHPRQAAHALARSTPAPARSVILEVRVTVPAHTPMVDVAEAITRLAETVGGTWAYRQPLSDPPQRGYFAIEPPPSVDPLEVAP